MFDFDFRSFSSSIRIFSNGRGLGDLRSKRRSNIDFSGTFAGVVELREAFFVTLLAILTLGEDFDTGVGRSAAASSVT